MSITVVGDIGNDHAFSNARMKLAMRATVKDSVEKVQSMVRDRVDRFSDTGELWHSIKTSGPTRTSTNMWTGKVYSELEYADAIEYGWGPRFVEPRKKQALKWEGANGISFSKGHWVGGFHGHHMFEKASLEFDRRYAEDIAERNIRFYLGLDAGRRSVVF